MTILAIRPLDILMLRGNRLFGGGVHGSAAMPPWPSVIAGAVASRALADRGRVPELTKSPDQALELLNQELGNDFGVTHLALEHNNQVYLPVPADLLVTGSETEGYKLSRLHPVAPPQGIALSCALPLIPVLQSGTRKKTAARIWLRADGYARHLGGKLPDPSHVESSDRFWTTDPRLGIALDRASRTAATGAIYTTDGVAFRKAVRLLARFRGQNLPDNGLIRLGGDGRGAEIEPASLDAAQQLESLGEPQPGWRGFRMILATPGLFPQGWLPPGLDRNRILSCNGLKAELMAAAVSRHEVISGWDLARHAPKPARKAVPTGSCYWFRMTEGDTGALKSLRRDGLWPLLQNDAGLVSRKREGWNHIWFGSWEP